MPKKPLAHLKIGTVEVKLTNPWSRGYLIHVKVGRSWVLDSTYRSYGAAIPEFHSLVSRAVLGLRVLGR